MGKEIIYSDEDMELLLTCKNKMMKEKTENPFMDMVLGSVIGIYSVSAIASIFVPQFLILAVPFFAMRIALGIVNYYKNNKFIKNITNGKFNYRQFKKALNSGKIDMWERQNVPFVERVNLKEMAEQREKSFKYRKKSVLASADFTKRKIEEPEETKEEDSKTR